MQVVLRYLQRFLEQGTICTTATKPKFNKSECDVKTQCQNRPCLAMAGVAPRALVASADVT